MTDTTRPSAPMQDFDLVTGGAGFIGSHLVDALVARGRRVRLLDNLSVGRASNLAQHKSNPAVELWVGDVADVPAVLRAMLQLRFRTRRGPHSPS